MAFTWMIQALEVLMQPSPYFGRIDIVIPGTQIPRWFNKQNVGSSISMDPSPIKHDNNWIGVACCVAFVAHDDPTNLGSEWEERIWCSFETKKSLANFLLEILLEKDVVTVESDNLFLLYFTRETFIDYVTKGTHDLDGIKLATLITQPQGLHFEGKNIGYRWVFKEDLEQLNPTMMHSGNSSVWKGKFLTIDDQPQP